MLVDRAETWIGEFARRSDDWDWIWLGLGAAAVCALPGAARGLVYGDWTSLGRITGGIAVLGALLGHALVSVKTLDQVVGFFVGNADPQTADTFRGMRDAAADRRDRTAEAIAGLDEADHNRAFDAASNVVEAAYEEYVDHLESIGVNPKPVC